MEDQLSTYDWQRQFFVTDHVKHKNGFTLYKITSVVFPKKNPEAGTKIVVWKRFNEFKNLHKELKSRHEALHLGGNIPILIKTTFFDRFSEDVIRKRKKFIIDLLTFIARCPALFTADIFVNFFREGYYISEYDNRIFDKADSEDSDVSSILSTFIPSMGQVLNSEESASSAENSSSRKSKERNSIVAFHNTLKRDLENDRLNFNTSGRMEDRSVFSFASEFGKKGIPDYWEEAVAHADEAGQQEILGNYDVAFAMFKTAIVCLLSGVQGDNVVEHRMRVKELTSQYLMKAEWIYNNHLVALQDKPSTPKFSHIPWRSRSQLKRYKVVGLLGNNLLVHDVADDVFVVVKGVLKSSCPLDRSEICVLPKDVPYIVKLYAVHETETTVFFILEHLKYGKLWDHLEHYFNNGFINDNLDTEITCASLGGKDGSNCSSRNSVASSGSSTNDQSLSRLESSLYADTMSCESLSSHDENYFDLIEDYARAKSQKLQEIQDFNERRKQVELLRPVIKTTSQLNLKTMDDNYGQYRSQSLTDLVHENDIFSGSLEICRRDDSSTNDDYKMNSDEDHRNNEFSTSIDVDTQQLLRNAQKLIESINETLSKSENIVDEIKDKESESVVDHVESEADVDQEEPCAKLDKIEKMEIGDTGSKNGDLTSFDLDPLKDLNLYSAVSPITESFPSITEEYSITAVLQRNGITNELIKTWAAQILIAMDSLHQNGIICRDLNPSNILIADNGCIKLTYYFRYPNVDPSFDLQAKEKLYVAPEVSNVNSNITFASDWWSYGAILYELITSKSLFESHHAGINSHTILHVPEKIEVEAKSLLTELLRFDPNERLGSGISGADDIKSHPYFSGVNWEGS